MGSTRRWWALGGVALAVLAVGLDGTVLAVALPTLSTALHASATDLVWFSAAYLLALAAAMLPAGVLGDRFGRKRVLLGSLALFGAASAWAAESSTPAMFIAARTLSGAAGAGVIVMAMSALTVLFDERERPRAVGIWAAANFLALPAGPLLGGWLLSRFWWGWVFLLNVPVVLVGLLVVAVLVPESRAERAAAADWFGVAGYSVGLVGVVFGLAEAGQYGYTAVPVLVPLIAGAAVLGLATVRQRRLARTPGRETLVDPALLAARGFRWGTALAALTSLAMIGVLFTMPQYFQGVLGTDAIGSGLRLLPLIGGLVVGAAVAEPAVKRVGGKAILTAGFALLALGMLLGAATSIRSGEGYVATWLAVVGVGLGVALSASSAAALAALPSERSGIGAAVMQALQEVGSPFGSAVLGSVTLSGYRSRLPALPVELRERVRGGVFDGTSAAARAGSPQLLHDVRSAFVHGMSLALVVSAVIALAGAVLALGFFPSARAAPQAPPREQETRVG